MRVIKTELPNNSSLQSNQGNFDFVDSFHGELIDTENKFTVTDVVRAFFTSGPKWMGKLMSLRNKIVSIFGLKTSSPIINSETEIQNFKCEPGQQMGLFRVFYSSENEVVLGEDDKHLNFRVSLLLTQNPTELGKKNLTISTTVEFHNWFGRLYFTNIKPFHKLIVPRMLKGIIQSLEDRNK